ncbi:MAG: phage Gp37/Gp68 family protein [Rhodospirillaceae bacterium]|nr:phage Gp37/Gp68 family protein [Rhodospirillaceae bacterium]MYG50996.1 phage Gp37/Gp68 family protein [Rhodospirillaceae bacterium]
MADNSAIEWTDATWNPVTGCTKITRGCDNCYAARFAERWRGIEGHPYEQGFDLRLWPARLDQPARWRKPRMIFVNSMSDLFHKDVPREFIDKVFDRMEETGRHTYQVLTKRSSLMRDYLKRRYPGGAKPARAPAHIWCGVSVEDRLGGARIRHLQEAPATIRFLSMEPLIGPAGDIDLDGISWVIAGGESGPNARELRFEWVRDLRDRCANAGVPFFFKQWGGARPKSGGRLLDGKEWNEFPWHIASEPVTGPLQAAKA